MSHSDRLAQALALIESHNSNIESDPDKVNAAKFQEKLKKLGGTTEDALRECTWEDLEECGLPRILARKVAALFRAVAEVSKKEDDLEVSSKKAERMHPLHLLRNFDRNNPDSPIGKRLHELSKGKRFIILTDAGTINVEASHQELEQLKRGYAEREIVRIEDKDYRTYRVGDKKAEMADENPIYRTRPLRPNGDCDQTNRSWLGVSDVVRALVYLGVNVTGEIKVRDIDDAHSVLDKAVMGDAEKVFRHRYTKTAIRYDELKETGDLPKLKIVLSATQQQRANDPFYTVGSGHRSF